VVVKLNQQEKDSLLLSVAEDLKKGVITDKTVENFVKIRRPEKSENPNFGRNCRSADEWD
jgi:hypothetical protein